MESTTCLAPTTVGIVLSVLALTSCSGDNTPEDAIMAVVDQMNMAYAEGDVESFYQNYCRDYIDEARRSFPREEFLAQLEDEKSAKHGKITTLYVTDISVDGDTATATSVTERFDEDGEPNDDIRGTVKFVHEDGEWRFCGEEKTESR